MGDLWIELKIGRVSVIWNKEMLQDVVALEFKDGDVINLGFWYSRCLCWLYSWGVNVILQKKMGLFVLVRHQQRKYNAIWPILEDHQLHFYQEHRCLTYKLRLPLFVEAMLMRQFLGALEVQPRWQYCQIGYPRQVCSRMGGAMDLLVGAKGLSLSNILLLMDSQNCWKECTLPLSAKGVLDLVIQN